MSVRNAVIPAAASQTRFLSAIKALPKEMLRDNGGHSLQRIFQGFTRSGIEQAIFVTGEELDL